MVDVLRALEENKFHSWYNLRRKLSSYLTDKLTLDKELAKHRGCVNCIQWSRTGHRLLSGSDDKNVCLWEPDSRQPLLATIASGHEHNIFSVKFINGEKEVISGSGDGRVHHMDIEGGQVLSRWSCHSNRVKRCCTVADSEYIALSSSEDGTARQFDIREGHTCSARREDEEGCPNVLIRLKNQSIKCINSNPAQPHLICIGSEDPVTRVYDRRMLSTSNQNDESTVPVLSFIPGHLLYNKRIYQMHGSPSVTWCTWDNTGRYILSNMGCEQVYLYEMEGGCQVINLPSLTGEEMPSEPTTSGKYRAKPLDSGTKALKDEGNRYFNNKEYNKAVIRYSECIARYPDNVILLNNRAIALLKRAWKGDKYAAYRDSITALDLDPTNEKACLRQIQSLHEMDFNKVAWTKMGMFQARHGRPADPSFQSLSEKIDDAIESGLKEPVVADRSLLTAGDYLARFTGSCNVQTDIKEANFFGPEQEYIISGSDDEGMFLWYRPTQTLKKVIFADSMLVNCVQPHPNQHVIASSGLNNTVRLWSPHSDPNFDPDPLTNIDELSDAATQNQKMMAEYPLPFMRMGREGSDGGPLVCNPS